MTARHAHICSIIICGITHLKRLQGRPSSEREVIKRKWEKSRKEIHHDLQR